ncbi:histidine kinase [Hymenobacter qilianensis]|uniref:Histidine kinase n=2 Tax=Hymenobacter qilianensis TaxID=1385715 RepID=A0ACB5PS95_9BACT|nr:PAS domain S-box protein [Hymenobacter qilianensis]QNP52358.1 PAS domain-containing sensor histidine kinase [Hymenobacter qilianensis]GGF66884.1 histidine kinase [Hymenobacter qilianensis]
MSESAQFVNSEQRFRSLFENNLDIILFQDRNGVILDVNEPFLQLLHLSRADVLGRDISDFLPPELIAVFREKLLQAFQGTRVQFDVAVQFIGAEPKVLNISKVPLLVDGVVSGVHMVARDITDLTASHQLIEQQAKKLNTIFESVTDAVFLLDREWRLTFLNSEVERLLQVDRQHVLGRNLWTLFPDEVGGEFYHQYHQAFSMGRAVHFEAYYATLRLWLEVKAFPSEEGLSVYFSDVTLRHEAQASQEKLAQDLHRQNQDLQQFTYIVSHNLRGPLANAMGLSQLLTTPDPDQATLLNHLQTSLVQLDVVLQDMNTILTVRDKQDVADLPAPVRLTDVLDLVLKEMNEPLQKAGGQIVRDFPEALHAHGNRAYIYSIFLNLLSNSIKYRSQQRALLITITGSPHPEGGAQLTFADNGSGFDQEKAGAEVFKLYKRFHTSPSGRGMGLYLVKAHIESMGGTIAVKSEVEVGTQFFLYLP